MININFKWNYIHNITTFEVNVLTTSHRPRISRTVVKTTGLLKGYKLLILFNLFRTSLNSKVEKSVEDRVRYLDLVWWRFLYMFYAEQSSVAKCSLSVCIPICPIMDFVIDIEEKSS